MGLWRVVRMVVRVCWLGSGVGRLRIVFVVSFGMRWVGWRWSMVLERVR